MTDTVSTIPASDTTSLVESVSVCSEPGITPRLRGVWKVLSPSSRFSRLSRILATSPTSYISKGDEYQCKTLHILESDMEYIKSDEFQHLQDNFDRLVAIGQELVLEGERQKFSEEYRIDCKDYARQSEALKNKTNRSSMASHSTCLRKKRLKFDKPTQPASDQPNVQAEEQPAAAQQIDEHFLGARGNTHYVLVRHEGSSSESCRTCRSNPSFVPLHALAYQASHNGDDEGCRTGTDRSPAVDQSPLPDTEEEGLAMEACMNTTLQRSRQLIHFL
ncbi:hypothetical protein B0H21DRAFT_336554 [Amylocystis lapponica]|nr:hypothetical protein B0H21DRAFT_336554 [Amylocystis lapponica]